MKTLSLKGCGTALLTPFINDQVDYEAFVASVDRQISSGVDFLVPLGTTGETPCLSVEERIEVLKAAKAHSAGRPVIVGGGTNSLQGTIESMKLLEPYGPDAFLIVVPYYNKPSQQGQYEYFKAVASATDKPIVIYNVPGRTGANMQAATTLALARDVENIVAIKEASGIFAQASEIIREAPEGFSVLSGNDDDTLALMAAGAKGVVSVASNIAPKEVADMAHALLDDDIVTARALHHRLTPLFRNLFIESNPTPAKAAMAQLGLMENSLRLPLVKATQKTEDIIAKTLADLWQK
ncbi:MAG: 4-hydroxy-tetrahydrodipicolinate synthase [Bacteroidales bacterium]|nr:4-hydroxy-tetrahydrodipicolinate synthase [Bacteroidales bacterium]MBQ4287139.1 4-hydroxy-tetrahydrodipicolinate synthase [Bacteroidales bacterium]MBQ9888460.1 4-hydroxy-tetrahydrodipicolinate synthase [Bacteroidales bacterium]